MSYHQFRDDSGESYGSFEVFHVSIEESKRRDSQPDLWHCESGWYWHPCFPGCLPSGDPSGPFNNEVSAILDALGDPVEPIDDD
jgi:hypothetical protein